MLVIPAFILFAVWFVARSPGTARTGPVSGGDRRQEPARRVAASASLAMLGPTIAVSAQGIMGYRQDVGTVEATHRLCGSLPSDGSVVVVDPGMASGYMPLFRNVCGLPTASLDEPTEQSVDRVVSEIHDRGRTAVLAAPEWQQLALFTDVEPQRPFHVDAEMDPSTLVRPPTGHRYFNESVWVAVVPPRV